MQKGDIPRRFLGPGCSCSGCSGKPECVHATGAMAKFVYPSAKPPKFDSSEYKNAAMEAFNGGNPTDGFDYPKPAPKKAAVAEKPLTQQDVKK